jgi:dihydrodipicolinate synthase/N-acetylneuraminate lyase
VFTGVGVALATLFDADLAVDVDATRDHAVRLVEAGVQAVIVAGSTGEASTLDREERRALLSAVKEAVAVPVVAGTGAPSAGQAVTLSLDALSAGADALLVLSPPGAADTLPYYASVREAVPDLPLLGSHYPTVSAPGIAVEALAGLPIDGVKDSSGDANRLLATLESFDRPLYTGSSAVLSLAGPIGCTGAILGLANVDPEGCIAAFAGDGSAQRALAADHLAMGRAFPAGLKALMAARWGTPEHRRLP